MFVLSLSVIPALLCFLSCYVPFHSFRLLPMDFSNVVILYRPNRLYVFLFRGLLKYWYIHFSFEYVLTSDSSPYVKDFPVLGKMHWRKLYISHAYCSCYFAALFLDVWLFGADYCMILDLNCYMKQYAHSSCFANASHTLLFDKNMLHTNFIAFFFHDVNISLLIVLLGMYGLLNLVPGVFQTLESMGRNIFHFI